MSEDSSKVQAAIDATRQSVGDAVDAIANATGAPARAAGALGDRASVLKTKFADGAETLGDVTSRARERLPDIEPLRRSAQNPIALVIGVAAAGFIAGLLLPLTNMERKRLEPIGDELAQRATDVRDEVVKQGRQVVTETVAAARDSVEKHGRELASTIGTSAGELTGAANAVASQATQESPSKSGMASATASTEPGPGEAQQRNVEGTKTREALEKRGAINPKGSGATTT